MLLHLYIVSHRPPPPSKNPKEIERQRLSVEKRGFAGSFGESKGNAFRRDLTFSRRACDVQICYCGATSSPSREQYKGEVAPAQGRPASGGEWESWTIKSCTTSTYSKVKSMIVYTKDSQETCDDESRNIIPATWRQREDIDRGNWYIMRLSPVSWMPNAKKGF